MPYQFESRVRYSECDQNQKLKLTSLIDYFQDCSVFHSECNNVGVNYQHDIRKVWMILSWQIEIFRLPNLGEKVISQTWPYAFKAFMGRRNYVLRDEQMNCLARANSMWAWVDLNTGHPTKIRPEDVSGYVLEEKLDMPEYDRKVPMPEASREMEPVAVTRNQLDTNRHVNNGQYISMAQDYLPEKFDVQFLRVEYRHQARLHDIIVPWVYEEDNRVTVSLCDKEKEPYTVLEFYNRAKDGEAGYDI